MLDVCILFFRIVGLCSDLILTYIVGNKVKQNCLIFTINLGVSHSYTNEISQINPKKCFVITTASLLNRITDAF